MSAMQLTIALILVAVYVAAFAPLRLPEERVRQPGGERRKHPHDDQPVNLQEGPRDRPHPDVRRGDRWRCDTAHVEQCEPEWRGQKARLKIDADHDSDPDWVEPEHDQRSAADREHDENDFEGIE